MIQLVLIQVTQQLTLTVTHQKQRHMKQLREKNGGEVPKGSYYNKTGDIVTPKDTDKVRGGYQWGLLQEEDLAIY